MQAREKLTEALPIGANWNRNEGYLGTLNASEEEIESRINGPLTELPHDEQGLFTHFKPGREK